MVRIMNLQEEAWTAAPSPELEGYEVSTAGRVRSWTTTNGKAHPYVHEGRRSGEDIVYDLNGETYTIDEPMRWTYGDEEWEPGHVPGERDRVLSRYERDEIVLAEGHKPAWAVAEEFRIDTFRVRAIWDGLQ